MIRAMPESPAPMDTAGSARPILLPDIPALVAGARAVGWVGVDGDIETLSVAEARRRLRPSGNRNGEWGGNPAPVVVPLLCHGPATARRLDLPDLVGFDLLELFAFVRPAQFCLPTPKGLAEALDLPRPRDVEEEALLLRDAAALLLSELRLSRDAEAQAIARKMRDGGWFWAGFALAALSEDESDLPNGLGTNAAPRGLAAWRAVPEIENFAPAPPPGTLPVDESAARRKLAEVLGHSAEDRPAQGDFASAVARGFRPRDRFGAPNIVLAEAGTGVGKTLGYLAPAAVWSDLNSGAVWVSTYTRNLQHQIDAELDRLYPDAETKARKAVLRKGRENYLCLLNFEELVHSTGPRPVEAITAGLMARWIAATRDGDLTGGDLPGWLPELLGRGRTMGLADRRGECIHSACHHFDRCFIERAIRKARRADIVVANHALVMIQAALGGGEDGGSVPTHLVFDEGHHLFDAADSAFSAHLSANEGVELRRWLLGAEGGMRSRARGLRRRIEELIVSDAMQGSLDAILRAARILPAEAWQTRLGEGTPNGPVEAFLALVRQQVLARTADGGDAPLYNLECDLRPIIDGLDQAAKAAADALEDLARPAKLLVQRLKDRLEDEAETLDTPMRQRIEAMARALDRRLVIAVEAWIGMLRSVGGTTPDDFVDWLSIDRMDGSEADIGLHRHWVDPSRPFAQTVAAQAHGVVVASATLTNGSGNPEADWRAAERRLGTVHLPVAASRASIRSPFDYPNHTRVLVVTDVRKDDLGQVAAAYRALFQAAGGGALGLFTAISRLRAVHRAIAPAMEEAGIPLYAQHVDAMETSTLIDIFRAEEDACLLGTDAVRDGVDVPGRSLRLIVFDRVPWPRPDILHRARREAFGGRVYDDTLTRLKLKQAFGRLIRRTDDRGVFVLLDPMMPSRLTTAFPPGVEVQRVGLADAVRQTASFFFPGAPAST